MRVYLKQGQCFSTVRLCGVSPGTISKVKSNFHIMGDKPQSGRPKKMQPQVSLGLDCLSPSGPFALVSARPRRDVIIQFTKQESKVE